MKNLCFILLILFVASACKTKKITAFEKRGHIVLKDISLVNQSIHNLISPYKDSLSAIMSEVITHSDTEMKRIKTEPETLLGNFVADLVFNYGSKQTTSTDFCLLNFGGLRNSLPKGNITVKDIFKLMPFENNLVNITMSYDSLISLTNYLAKEGGQPISNAKIIIQDTICKEFWVGDKQITSTQISDNFTVITSDYLANGGDHMVFFLNPIKREPLNIKLRDAILNHCRNTELIQSTIEGRVTIIK